jgi:hypothetical protein
MSRQRISPVSSGCSASRPKKDISLCLHDRLSSPDFSSISLSDNLFFFRRILQLVIKGQFGGEMTLFLPRLLGCWAALRTFIFIFIFIFFSFDSVHCFPSQFQKKLQGRSRLLDRYDGQAS